MRDDLHEMFGRERQERQESFAGEKAIVSNTANSPDDTVYVTLPNSEAPTLKEEVTWRVGVQFDGAGVAQPRYPQSGDEGIVIENDEGDLWLIW